MLDNGESQKQKEVIRPDFNQAIRINFQGATISSDTGFIILREADERFKIIEPIKDCLEDLRSPAHTNHALVQMVLAYNLLHMIRQFYVWGEEVRRSIDSLINRLIKEGARISYHARRWYVHVASAFPLAHYYRAVLVWALSPQSIEVSGF